MWWIGDWLHFGERKYGEAYAQAIEETKYGYQALRDAQWVAGKIEFCRRRQDLSWSHHREVAVLDPAVADKLLDGAEAENWSRNELRAAVTKERRAARSQR